MVSYSKEALAAIQQAFERFKDDALSDPNKAIIYTSGKYAASDSIQLTPEQINGLTRCWTDDMTVPFYLARSQMSPNWYITDGILITVSGQHKKVYWQKGLETGEGQRKRLKHRVNFSKDKRIYLDLPIIYGLVTGTLDAPESTKRQIAEHGLYAIRGIETGTGSLDVHHVDRHTPYLGQPVPEYEEQNKNVQLLPTRLHSKMHAVNGKIIEKTPDDKEGTERLAQMGECLPEEDGPYMIVEKGDTTQFVNVATAMTAVDNDGSRLLAPKMNVNGKVVKTLLTFVVNGQIYRMEV